MGAADLSTRRALVFDEKKLQYIYTAENGVRWLIWREWVTFPGPGPNDWVYGPQEYDYDTPYHNARTFGACIEEIDAGWDDD